MTDRFAVYNGGCPARAGIGPARSAHSHAMERLPRASGDRPILTKDRADADLVAPRERG
mgnify:CR=1 FL=1